MIRRPTYERLKRLSEGPFPASTIRYARRYLLDHPRNGIAWHMLAAALVESGRYEEAEQALSKAIQFCPLEKQQIPLAMMGHLFEQSGDYEQAVDWFRKAIAADPSDAKYHLYLGTVLAKQGKLHEAVEVLQKAIQCTEGRLDEAHLALGMVLRSLDRFPEAADCFREAIRVDSTGREARRALRDVERCMRWSH